MFNYEMKYILIFILSIFLSSCSSETQNIEKVPERALKNDKEYISLSYFHIFKKNIPNRILEKCVSVITTTSDKDLVKDLIVRSWIFKTPIKNENFLVEDYYRTIYPASPLITSNFNINELLKLINFYILNEIHNRPNFQIFSDGPTISKNLNYLCPQIKRAYDSEQDCLKANEYIIHQAIKNPHEINSLIIYFKSNIIKLKKQFSSTSNEDAYYQLKNKIFNLYPMMEYYFTEDSIDKCLEATKTTSSIPSIKEIKKDIPTFIENTYTFLLSRQPTEIEMSEWTTYYSNQSEAIPGMILYIIIMSNEYKYF